MKKSYNVGGNWREGVPSASCKSLIVSLWGARRRSLELSSVSRIDPASFFGLSRASHAWISDLRRNLTSLSTPPVRKDHLKKPNEPDSFLQ